jgi:hypothetical protein
LGDSLNLFFPILFYTTSLQFSGLRDISVVGVLSARERTCSIILEGDLGPLENPFRIVVSDRPHLVYDASLQDLLEPTKEVVIAFMYRAENGNNVFHSRTLPHGAFK